MSQVETLLSLKDKDTELLRLKKQLETLPEAKQIMECRAKRRELKGKQDEVVELADGVEAQLARLQAAEEAAIRKINELQAKLDATSDYRVTRSVTKDMEGQVKRQASLAEEQNGLLERQIKIDKLADQVADMLAKLDHKEEHLTADFKEKGGALKARMEQLQGERAGLVGQLDEALAKRYVQLHEEKNGVAVAVLDQGRCTACSTTILTGQLAKLQAGPAIAACPNCHRIMVVADERD